MHAASSSAGPTSAGNDIGGRARTGRGAGGLNGGNQRGRGGVHRGRVRGRRGGGLRDSRRGPGRGGYQGSGVALTAVEPGYRYFKKSFLLNPWEDLECKFTEAARNSEEIDICVDDIVDGRYEEEGLNDLGACSEPLQKNLAEAASEGNMSISIGPHLSSTLAEAKVKSQVSM